MSTLSPSTFGIGTSSSQRPGSARLLTTACIVFCTMQSKRENEARNVGCRSCVSSRTYAFGKLPNAAGWQLAACAPQPKQHASGVVVFHAFFLRGASLLGMMRVHARDA
jgi:hypothetical protein